MQIQQNMSPPRKQTASRRGQMIHYMNSKTPSPVKKDNLNDSMVSKGTVAVVRLPLVRDGGNVLEGEDLYPLSNNFR